MTKINKSNLALRSKRLANNALQRTNKLTVKRLKLAVCDENHASSSDDDHWPLLPPTSSSSSSISGDLSTIEEEKTSTSISTLSTSPASSTNSKYLSSFLASSVTSISSISEDEESDSFKEFHDDCKVEVQNESENKPQVVGKNESQSNMETGSSSANDNVVVNITAESSAHFEDHHSVIEEIEHLGVEIIQSTLSHSPDIESYHQTKNFAFLLLNLALVSSNGNQIKYLLESQEQRPFFYYSLAFIGASLVFQLLAKLFSLTSYRYSLSSQEGAIKLRRLNGFLIIFTMMITVLNVAISVLILLEIYEILPV